MGREQGDHLPKDPVMYVGEVDGEKQERAAYTAADEANLAARGWVPKDHGKRGGKRTPAAQSTSPRADAGDTASSNA
jgi:hypothetical protein